MSINYLYTPCQTIVDPPIDTKDQVLPLEKLSWEDFEKLCLAVVQTDFSINDCEIYGIRGQAQEGIDIFARQENGRYSSYQCKRYKELDLDDINKAVDHFKSKAFFSKSDKLYLCTSCELNKTQLQDRFEILKTELLKENKTLVKWDKIQLSRILKCKPQIVFDFFGSEWVKKFNGETALQQISKSKKIDARHIVKFRKELYEFYSTIFNIQDPGIPIKELNSPYTLQDRFIIPEIISSLKEEGFEPNNENSSSKAHEDLYYYNDYWYNQPENEFRRKPWNYQDELAETSIDIRIKIDDALLDSNRNIVLGDPGAGKSTLLRYIALDILSSNPKLENILQKYGKTLPVWLPFAFITKHLSQDDSLSISDILNLWFKSFGKNHLFEIAKDALEDDRLFLIIDGIDEWNSISSAQQAIARIEIIRNLYNCNIIYSSRPYGFRILKDFFTNLNILNLAGFSSSQQRRFVENWFTKWASLKNDSKDKSLSKTLTDNFIKELEQAGDLKKLAETPLLLSILIIQKMQDYVLPKNKLEALIEITQYLIKKHPSKRITEAGIVQEKTNDIDFKDIFCELAIFIQKSSNDGVILKSEALKIVEQYLIEYAGYDKANSKARSEELIQVGANDFGIIIEKSNNEISFGHKQFQEFLAAQRLYDSDEEYVNEFINKYAANPSFHQVIVNFFGLIPTKQLKKYSAYFDALKNAIHEKYQENYLKLITYEVAINLDNTPNEIANNSFDSIISDFEYETDATYKEALLRRILDTLQNARLKEKTQIFLLQYFPNQNKYRDYRINALKNCNQLNELQFEFLKKTFINGTIELRYDASYVFNRHIKNEKVLGFVENIILNCSNPNILAFAINSAITNDITEQDRNNLLKSIEITDPIVQFYLLKHKIFSNKQTQEDLKLLLQVINQTPFQLRQEAINLLINGFDKNIFLKEILIKSLDRKKFYGENKYIIDLQIAWKVLFHSFNRDADIIELVKSQFENEENPFSLDRNEMFKNLIYYFKGVNELISSVEKWMDNRLKKYSYVDPEIAFLSIFLHSEKEKNIILHDLPNSTTSHWNVMALLDGWPEDKEVKEKLKEYFRTVEIKKISAAAHFVSKIFEDHEKEEAIKILEDILFDKKIMFRERAISALIEIDKGYFENNVLKRLIDDLESFPKDFFSQYYAALEVIIESFYSNKMVQDYILERIENDNILHSLSIQHFPQLIKNEEKMLRKSIPLSKELRLLIIEKFAVLPILPYNIEIALSDFETEAEEVMADMAVCLFNHIKGTNESKIISLSKPLIFARGFDYELKRSIAFLGFLISKKIDDYFEVEDVQRSNEDKSKRVDIFNEFTYRNSSSGIVIKSLIDNFDYLISNTNKDLNSIVENLKFKKNAEEIWGFFARHSTKSSPTYIHIMEFISNNSTIINNNSIISFLNRVSPKSNILKGILLRFINDDSNNSIIAGRLLGTNFNSDSQVYNIVNDIKDINDNGKIMALCMGWPKEPILKKIFDDCVRNQYQINEYVGFNLKFLFRDVTNLTEFLKNIFTGADDIKRYHRYFFVPMIERLRRDKDFKLAVKKLLLCSTSINEKISFYNLLSHVNSVDEDVILWKKEITDFKNDFGYDIVSNKTVRLKDILFDYYY